MRFLPVALACLILGFASTSTSAETWIVNAEGTGDFPDITSAVAAAANGDEILLADGTYTGSENRNVSFLGKAITIRSESGNAETCIIEFQWSSGQDVAFRMRNGEGPSSVVEDITLVAPVYSSADAAFDLWGSSPTIRRVTFRCQRAIWASGGASPQLEDSFLENGASLLFRECTPVVTGCFWEAGSLMESHGQVRVADSTIRIENCTGSPDYVGLYNTSAEVRGCEFRETGFSADGAGVDLLIEDCRFLECRDVTVGGPESAIVVRGSAFRDGGGNGIRLYRAATATIESCDIQGNQFTGVSVQGTQVLMRDCLITGNHLGGLTTFGWSWEPTSLTVEDCTIASNASSHGLAGAVHLRENVDATIRRTILWGDCAESGDLIWVEGGPLTLDCVSVDTSLIGGEGPVQVVGELLEGDPLFCDPLDCAQVPSSGGDFALQKNSPALFPACGVMGGLGAGCEPISVESTSWGALKAMYR